VKTKNYASSPENVGHAGAYETLKTECESAANTGVRVMWDRRQGERRGTVETIDRERRQRERRGTAPLTWTSLAVVVVAVDTTDPSSSTSTTVRAARAAITMPLER
jgi:hypothetical protein